MMKMLLCVYVWCYIYIEYNRKEHYCPHPRALSTGTPVGHVTLPPRKQSYNHPHHVFKGTFFITRGLARRVDTVIRSYSLIMLGTIAGGLAWLNL